MSPSAVEVQSAVRQLREYHRLGKEIVDEYRKEVNRRLRGSHSGRAKPATSIMDDISARYGLAVHVARVLRKFADTDTKHGHGYTKAELDELCALCKEHQQNVGLTQVRHLVTIRDQNERVRFQTRMIKERWTSSRAVAELIRRFGRRRQGGRKPQIADDVDGVLIQIQSLATTWRRWFDLFSRGKTTGSKKELKVTLSDLAPDLQSRLREVDVTIQALEARLTNQDCEPDRTDPTTSGNRSSRQKRDRRV